ncbi:MAG TPA: response regulator transcription factor [Desulfobacterales bacterium]|nr:response regulator transcription factor [Desulfobacterales bacterium]
MNEIVAIVDDEADLRELLRTSLAREGFRVREHSRGAAFLSSLAREVPDAVVLDVMLPDIDGMEVCRRLRMEPRGASLPVIMLTARVAEGDRVLGLELGADDYVTKPFSPKELAARVRAVLRRSGRGAADGPAGAPVAVGGIAIDRAAHTVAVAGRHVDLTAAEFRLLEVLASRPGQVFSREQILDGLWGDEKSVTDRSVDVHIRHLREKFGDAGARIANVRGVGYKLEP